MNKKLICLILSLCMLLPLLAGCHGSRGLREFAVPEEFDTNRDYEITFWAKNDTNKTQTQNRLSGAVPEYPREPSALYRLWQDI